METILVFIVRVFGYITLLLLLVSIFEEVAFGSTSVNIMLPIQSVLSVIVNLPVQVLSFATQLVIAIADLVIAVVWDLASLDSIVAAPSFANLI